MGVYIERDGVRKAIDTVAQQAIDNSDGYVEYIQISALNKVSKIVEQLPDLDLVRCGECKWWDYETSGCTEIHPLAPFRERDFCSYGERRADE